MNTHLTFNPPSIWHNVRRLRQRRTWKSAATWQDAYLRIVDDVTQAFRLHHTTLCAPSKLALSESLRQMTMDSIQSQHRRQISGGAGLSRSVAQVHRRCLHMFSHGSSCMATKRTLPH